MMHKSIHLNWIPREAMHIEPGGLPSLHCIKNHFNTDLWGFEPKQYDFWFTVNSLALEFILFGVAVSCSEQQECLINNF